MKSISIYLGLFALVASLSMQAAILPEEKSGKAGDMVSSNTTENTSPKDTVFTRKQTLRIMERVADWQINYWNTKGFKGGRANWINGAGFAGMVELPKISKNPVYEETLLKVGEDLNWNTGAARFDADDYCVGQLFCQLYMRKKDKIKIRALIQLADSIVEKPHTESLEWKNDIRAREWAWCDALFMGPTTLAYLSTATGDPKYLSTAIKLWWKTTDYLFDKDEHLYYRDQSFFNQREANGKKMFWSRGNGWVMGGLVRVLDNVPANHPERKKLVALYKEMALKIASLQQEDGGWRASLLDPGSYPGKEMSGTAFYCYAILWGINNKVLDKKKYWPVAKKAWETLVSSVHPDGMLGYVQAVGAAPKSTNAESTEAYGTGAFLLAGSQLHKLLDK